jgi:hypothetical protein
VLITLPSLAMSPMTFWLMAYDLRWASWAWLRAAASCSRAICDRSSSVLASKRRTERQVTVDLRTRRRQRQVSTLTLKLLRQAPDGAILLDDLEEGGVQLLLHLRQLSGHPGANHASPCDHDQQVRTSQDASSE